MKVDLYFFRHGETEWNRLKRFQGSTDIPLNSKGKEQALKLQKLLEELNIDAVLSSDLVRAKETTEIATANLDCPVHFFSDLREANLGDVEGILRHEFDEIYGHDFWDRWKVVGGDLMDFAFPNGESPRQHLDRVLNCVNSWLENSNHKSVGISTHGGVIWRVVHFCEPNPQVPQTIENCGLYHVQIEDGVWKYVKSLTWNPDSHTE